LKPVLVRAGCLRLGKAARSSPRTQEITEEGSAFRMLGGLRGSSSLTGRNRDPGRLFQPPGGLIRSYRGDCGGWESGRPSGLRRRVLRPKNKVRIRDTVFFLRRIVARPKPLAGKPGSGVGTCCSGPDRAMGGSRAQSDEVSPGVAQNLLRTKRLEPDSVSRLCCQALAGDTRACRQSYRSNAKPAASRQS